MNAFYNLGLNLVAGFFFLLGGFISLKVKNKEKLNNFSIALAFGIMLSLIFVDLLPEIMELLDKVSFNKKLILIAIFASIGFLLLKILDLFIPDHHHDHHDNEKNNLEHMSHLNHIGLLTIISLLLHNVIEGFAIGGMSNNNLKIALFISLGVALHNIPLGTHIFSLIDIKQSSNLIVALTLSSAFGGLLFLLTGNISNYVLGIITSITLGMILYLTLMELLPEIITNHKNKETTIGLIIGMLILGISVFL